MARKETTVNLITNPVTDKFLAHLAAGGATQPVRDAISWADADGSTLQDAIATATEAGAGLLLSKTSDGGALTLIVFWKSKKLKYYPVDAEKLNELLTDLTAAAQAAIS